MSYRQTLDREAAAAEAGFWTATGYQIEARTFRRRYRRHGDADDPTRWNRTAKLRSCRSCRMRCGRQSGVLPGNLGKGCIGDDSWSLLGGFPVTTLGLAAFS